MRPGFFAKNFLPPSLFVISRSRTFGVLSSPADHANTFPLPPCLSAVPTFRGFSKFTSAMKQLAPPLLAHRASSHEIELESPGLVLFRNSCIMETSVPDYSSVVHLCPNLIADFRKVNCALRHGIVPLVALALSHIACSQRPGYRVFESDTWATPPARCVSTTSPTVQTPPFWFCGRWQ